MPDAEWTPQRIANLRVQNALTHDEFGYIVGCNGKTVRSWELGDRAPSLASRLLMEQLLDPVLLKHHMERLKERF